MKNADTPASPCTIHKNVQLAQQLGQMAEVSFNGLTKREMFAMHAMQGLLSGNSIEDIVKLCKVEKISNVSDYVEKFAFTIADTMLEDKRGQ